MTNYEPYTVMEEVIPANVSVYVISIIGKFQNSVKELYNANQQNVTG